VNPEIKFIFSIDPGFNSSGFTFIDIEKKEIQMWSAQVPKIKILGLPMPDLFKVAIERSKFYIDQIPVENSKNLEIIIEYTSLGLQFSTSLNVLVGVFVSQLFNTDRVSQVTFVPPKTSHWIIQKRKASAGEMRVQVEKLLPINDWLRKGYRMNAHTVDSLLFATYCNMEMFKSFGFELPNPKRPVERKKGFIYVK